MGMFDYFIPGKDKFWKVADPANLFGQHGTKDASAQGVNSGAAAQGNPETMYANPNGDGTYIDKSTGVVFADAEGKSPVANANSAQQVAANIQQRELYQGKLAASEGQLSSSINGEGQLAGQLDGTINGTAPSVAAMQLQQSQDAIARQQQSMAAGASGVNAFAARRQAMANIGNSQTAAAGEGAIARAKEVQGAMGLKAGVLSSIAGQAQQQYGTNVNAASDANHLAQAGEAGIEGQNSAAANAINAQNAQREAAITGAASSAVAAYATGGASAAAKKPKADGSA